MMQSRFSNRGTTMVEVLLCVGIIAILLVIVMPSFKRIRLSADETAAMSALRQCTVAVMGYATDHRLSLPFLVPTGSDEPTSFAGQDVPPGAMQHFLDQSRYWPTVAMSWFSGTPTVGSEPAIWQLELDGILVQRTRFWMTCNAFAAPGYWETLNIPNDATLFRGVRLSEARFPSRKGILLDTSSGVFQIDQSTGRSMINHALIATGDGAVGRYPWPPPAEVVARPGVPAWPVLSTRGGIAGVDVPANY